MNIDAAMVFIGLLALPAVLGVIAHYVMIVLGKGGSFIGHILVPYVLFSAVALFNNQLQLFVGYSAILIALIQLYKRHEKPKEVQR